MRHGNGIGRRWQLLAAGSLVLLGLGTLFMLQDLGTASKYAGVGSFFVGLVGAAMTATSLMVALRTARRAERDHATRTPVADDVRKPEDRQPDGWNSGLVPKSFKNSTAIFHPQGDVVVNNRYGAGSRKRSKQE